MHVNDSRIYVKKYAKTPDNPYVFPINKKEALRYCGYLGMDAEKDSEVTELFDKVADEVKDILSYSVCYREISLEDPEARESIDFLFQSQQISSLLCHSSHVVLMAATVGMELDIRAAKYSRISPAKALIMQGLGAERIETLCDSFCKEYATGLSNEGLTITPRFSPGYGDLPLDVQKDFFRVCDIYHQIGISLSDNLFMKPTKSVTALFGICKSEDRAELNKCQICDKTNCEFKK